MLIFELMRYKNFLSSGNNFTELKFDEAKSTLIVGDNGAGKSTILDALSYGLFGKPYRKIKIPQLVNAINKKQSVVEIYFSVGPNKYKIVRGQKPAIFEVWRNDEMINQNSTAAVYQKELEDKILKTTHKAFHQIVVLGTTSFTPFMQLNAADRRAVIEELLDINVFTKMNIILKKQIADINTEISTLDRDISMNVVKLEAEKKSLVQIQGMSADEVKKNNKKIDALTIEIDNLTDSHKALLLGMKEIHTVDIQNQQRQLNTTRKALETYQTQFNQEVRNIVKDVQFYENNDVCPTCEQPIEEPLKASKKAKHTTRAKTLQEAITTASEELQKVDGQLQDLQTSVTKYNTLKNSADTIVRDINSKQDMIRFLKESNDKIQDTLDSTYGGYGVEDTIDEITAGIERLTKKRAKHIVSLSYKSGQAEMLKDTGVKSKIIKDYVPIINLLVNEYLSAFDFFVQFNLDQNFEETIRSRHRDTFSYESFSEGEKQRIDLALLFTWRQIAKMKNSVDTNILIMDETFDSSLDATGMTNLNKIFDAFEEGTRIMVISHKGEELGALFEQTIRFGVEKNFSVIK